MKIGIFGGSFNPAHIGHYKIVEHLLSLQKVAKVIIVPNYTNPLKSSNLPVPMPIKWQILTATFSDCKNIEFSDYETKRNEPSYTVNTLKYFHSIYPKDQLYFIVGEDAFQLFPKWQEPQEILRLSKILIIPRPKQREPMIDLSTISDKAEWVSIEVPDISSTQIRSMSLETLKVNNFMTPEAFKIWQQYKQ